MNKALIGIDRSGSFRVYLAITTDMAEDARKIHNTSPTATSALGRVLTGAGLMGLMLKNDKDKLTVQFKGDGPAGEILATASGSGNVKGYISNPDVELPLLADGRPDVGGAVGIGVVTVIKDQGLKEPYVGRIDLVSGEIAEDLTAYFFISEQQSTSVALGVKVDTDGTVAAAGGMIIQMLPNAEPDCVDALENLLYKLPSFSNLVDKASENEGESDEEVCDNLLHKIFDNMPPEFHVSALEYRDIRWKCDCSTERLERVLLSIGEEDLTHILEEDGKADITCQFCTREYHFDKEHLEMLLRVATRSREILENRRKNKEGQPC